MTVGCGGTGFHRTEAAALIAAGRTSAPGPVPHQ